MSKVRIWATLPSRTAREEEEKTSKCISWVMEFFFLHRWWKILILIAKVDLPCILIGLENIRNLLFNYAKLFVMKWKMVQFNECQTDPCFLQLSQNMPADCLFTFVLFPILAWIYLICAKNCFVLMFKIIFSSKQVNSGKNREKHIRKQTITCQVFA